LAGSILAAAVAVGLSWAAPAAAEETEVVRGILRAAQQATLTTDLGARITAIGFKEGVRFAKGDALITFDCGRLEAELAAATGRFQAEKLTYDNLAVLQRSRAVGAIETRIAKAKADAAQGEADVISKKMTDCVIEAPFGGSVAGLAVNPQETPGPATPLMTIVDDGPLEVDALVPSRWLKWLQPGMTGTLHLDELDLSVTAEIVRIGAVVDPVSQTVKVTGRLTGHDPAVRPGMSGAFTLAAPGG
jgi:RND family efflux transporter MFP subunit